MYVVGRQACIVWNCGQAYKCREWKQADNCVDVGPGKITFHLLACHEDLVNSVVDNLNSGTGVVEAWLCAYQELPGVQDLADLKRLHPTAMPSWLALENPDIRVVKPVAAVLLQDVGVST